MELDDEAGILENEGGEELPEGDRRGVNALTFDPIRFSIHEPLTRVASVAWNPNVEFGWWAAAGMASGLVRIMDLGVE